MLYVSVRICSPSWAALCVYDRAMCVTLYKCAGSELRDVSLEVDMNTDCEHACFDRSSAADNPESIPQIKMALESAIAKMPHCSCSVRIFAAAHSVPIWIWLHGLQSWIHSGDDWCSGMRAKCINYMISSDNQVCGITICKSCEKFCIQSVRKRQNIFWL